MLRTQVQFTTDQARRLRAIARRRGTSVAALVRQAVDRVLLDESRQPAALYERAAKLVGAFADREGTKDLSRRHDDHLRESYD
jgi:ribbon-helix-helix CopG family protein